MIKKLINSSGPFEVYELDDVQKIINVSNGIIYRKINDDLIGYTLKLSTNEEKSDYYILTKEGVRFEL